MALAILPFVRSPRFALGLSAFVSLAACAGGDAAQAPTADGESVAQANTSLDCGSEEVAPTRTCSSLAAALQLPNVRITRTQEVAARPNVEPAHCVIGGKINERTGSDGKRYAIGFEVRLPKSWNRRFFFQGGAGTDGILLGAYGTLPDGRRALDLGYAVTSTDGGHEQQILPLIAGGALFGLDPQARVDYGYNAVGTVTKVAKQVIAAYYASAPARSYFVGCSNGGRQAMVSAARFADEFDGILAGDPGFNLPKAGIQHAWDTQQFLSVSPKVQDAFTVPEMNVVGQRILERCDALDGAADGMVFDLAGCQSAFDLTRDVETCTGARTGSCLTVQQKTALANVMKGPRNSRGEQLYADWPWDPGIAASAGNFFSWRTWKLFNPLLGASMIATLGGSALPYVFVTPPVDVAKGAWDVVAALQTYLAKFDFDVDAPKIAATSGAFTESSLSFMTPPDPTRLSALQGHGKLIVYHGAADPVFSVNDSIHWYEQLQRDTPGADDFARLFVVPGMGHCSAGVATDSFDLFSPLVAWVEGGQAPESVVARRAPGDNPDVPATWSKDRTRPLCAWPKHAVRNADASDLEQASSFHCE